MFDNNFSINKQKHNKNINTYEDYIDTTGDILVDSSNENYLTEVDMMLNGDIGDMRREYKRSVKKLRNFYSDKEPKLSGNKTIQFSGSHLWTKPAAV